MSRHAAITTRRKRIVARALHAGTLGLGCYWEFTLACGHHVTRRDHPAVSKQKTADCYNCPPTVRGGPLVKARVLGE